jgi:hypothetical protein
MAQFLLMNGQKRWRAIENTRAGQMSANLASLEKEAMMSPSMSCFQSRGLYPSCSVSHD